MKILENLQKAHDLLDNCNAENDSGGCCSVTAMDTVNSA